MTKAAVVGSGFGGLAAAIRLQTLGFQTTLIEKRDKPGGRAYVYYDNGFTFDAGPTVITAPHCLSELFHLSNRRIQDYIDLVSVYPFYRLYWEDGYTFDYSNNDHKLFNQIEAKSPADVEGYKQFRQYSKDVFREGYQKLAAVPFLNWWSMVRVSPQLARLSAHRTVYSMVSKYINDPHLRQAFSFHSLLVGGNPFAASSIYTLIHYLERKWGVYFPRGGTNALIRALCVLFKELGGTLRLNTAVDQIVTQNKKVTGLKYQSGHIEPFDFVVSNADVVHTYKHLLRKEPSVRKKAETLSSKRHSMSLFLIYFGTNKKYPQMAHHNVLFGPRYRELLDDIFEKGRLADDFSLYLHVPSQTDPTLAPPGGENFYVLSPVPHLGAAQIDWETEGSKYADKILTYLEQRYLPGLKKHLVTQRIFTPADFQTELNAHWGSAFSLEPILRQSAYFRTHNRDKSIEGLYFVGAGTHPGAGIPGVVNSAKATSDLIISDWGKPVRLSPQQKAPAYAR